MDRDEWIAEARTVPIETALERRGVRLKGAGAERVGPCPVCGGTDRFAINTRKGLFLCRGSGTGGDVIALTRYLEACDFVVACEILTGRPQPGREAGETPEARAAREAALAKRAAARARMDAGKEAARARFRERERRRCWDAWQAAGPVAGSPAESYLARRGLIVPPGADLRCALDHPLYADGSGKAAIVHRGPALLARIIGPNRKFAGVHATWIDLDVPGGKVLIGDPDTGELVPAKKVRGSAGGGHITLVPRADATGLFIGEGIETVLSVWRALSATSSPHLAGAAFWSAYSLGNIAGPATETVRHPTLRFTDTLGRERARRVPGSVPDLSRPGLQIPESVARIWLLGDGDSDRFTTETALARARRRLVAGRPDLDVRICWAPEGECVTPTTIAA
ncbi:hypothetical protein ADL19_06605 [Streptomyces purpurogeneiscleroticus]|nr:hypothetical protein ADL19_06605 [Streptomyces purpurogeneiscleroticus]